MFSLYHYILTQWFKSNFFVKKKTPSWFLARAISVLSPSPSLCTWIYHFPNSPTFSSTLHWLWWARMVPYTLVSMTLYPWSVSSPPLYFQHVRCFTSLVFKTLCCLLMKNVCSRGNIFCHLNIHVISNIVACLLTQKNLSHSKTIKSLLLPSVISI